MDTPATTLEHQHVPSPWGSATPACYVRDAYDVLFVLSGCCNGLIPQCDRKLEEAEKSTYVVSGWIVVVPPGVTGAYRWRDGVDWSPNRIMGPFLIYRQTNAPTRIRPSPGGAARRPRARRRARPKPVEQLTLQDVNDWHNIEFDWWTVGSLRDNDKFTCGGLCRKTISVKLLGHEYRVISYYNPLDVHRGKLPRASEHRDLAAAGLHPLIFNNAACKLLAKPDQKIYHLSDCPTKAPTGRLNTHVEDDYSRESSVTLDDHTSTHAQDDDIRESSVALDNHTRTHADDDDIREPTVALDAHTSTRAQDDDVRESSIALDDHARTHTEDDGIRESRVALDNRTGTHVDVVLCEVDNHDSLPSSYSDTMSSELEDVSPPFPLQSPRSSHDAGCSSSRTFTPDSAYPPALIFRTHLDDPLAELELCDPELWALLTQIPRENLPSYNVSPEIHTPPSGITDSWAFAPPLETYSAEGASEANRVLEQSPMPSVAGMPGSTAALGNEHVIDSDSNFNFSPLTPSLLGMCSYPLNDLQPTTDTFASSSQLDSDLLTYAGYEFPAV